MNCKTFNFNKTGYIITHTRNTFSKTESGKSWKTKPTETKTETINNKQYENWVTSIPFFNGFCGGTCRGCCGYTVAGYLPTKITSVSPDKSLKHVDVFAFEVVKK